MSRVPPENDRGRPEDVVWNNRRKALNTSRMRRQRRTMRGGTLGGRSVRRPCGRRGQRPRRRTGYLDASAEPFFSAMKAKKFRHFSNLGTYTFFPGSFT